jgi:hypothetical protein
VLLLAIQQAWTRNRRTGEGNKVEKDIKPWAWAAAFGAIGLVGTLVIFLVLNELFTEDPPRTRVAIGEAAEDGPFVFTVTEIECGLRNAPTLFPSRPQGQYCVAKVRVVNRGVEASNPIGPWTMHVGERRYPATDELGSAFRANIFPDGAAEGTLVFDIPQDAEPSAIELHHEFGSSGILIVL